MKHAAARVAIGIIVASIISLFGQPNSSVQRTIPLSSNRTNK